MRISVAMIVKNEERFLAQCLASVEPYVDEIIVTDTGSTDRTVEIAEAFSKVRVTHFTWNGSFADARNHSLKGCTGDWVFVLDADEVLLPDSGKRLKDIVRKLEFHGGGAAFVRIHNAAEHAAPEAVASGEKRQGAVMSVPRLMKRRADVYFEGRIHENWGNSVTRAGLKIGETDLEIVHYGAMDSVRVERNKIERNVLALLREIEDAPTDPWWYGYLVMELRDHPEMFPVEVLDMVLEEGWKHALRANRRTSLTRLGVIRARRLHERQDWDEMLATVQRVEKTDGAGADTDFLAGSAYQGKGVSAETGSREQLECFLEAEQRFKWALTHTETNTFISGAASYAAIDQLGWLAFAFDEVEDARRAWNWALQLCPGHENALKGLEKLAMLSGTSAEPEPAPAQQTA